MRKSTSSVKNWHPLTLAVVVLFTAGCGTGERLETRPPVRPPEIDLAAEQRGLVNTPVDITAGVTSPDGRPVTSSWAGLPPGADVVGGTTVRWTPTAAGTWQATLTARDDRGQQSQAAIDLVARYPHRPDTSVTVGDSVAAGHGRDRADYLGRDTCWRSEDISYGALVHDRLVAAGRLGIAGEHVLVACSGHGSDDLAMTEVSASGGGLEGMRSQLDWAAVVNPALITITVGGNDIDFDDPAGVIAEGRLDEQALTSRVTRLADGLASVLDRLVAETDATVVITTYYDPSATVPQGVDGCRAQCFAEVIDQALDQVNGTILDAASVHPDRVLVADVRGRFAGHGAPNGVGPDAIRADPSSLLGDVIGGAIGGLQPYCAKGPTDGETWISRVDCVHPNDEGQRQIAATVVDVLG